MRRYFSLPGLKLSPQNQLSIFRIRSANSDSAHSSSALRTIIIGPALGSLIVFYKIFQSDPIELIKPSPFIQNYNIAYLIKDSFLEKSQCSKAQSAQREVFQSQSLKKKQQIIINYSSLQLIRYLANTNFLQPGSTVTSRGPDSYSNHF